MNRKVSMLCLSVVLASCSKIDDYMLGKDNTPPPAELKPIKQKVALENQWTVAAGSKINTHSYYKMKPVNASGIIYTADNTGVIEAINQKNGDLKWRQQINKEVVSGPSIYSDKIALTTSDAMVYVLSLTDGHTLWSKKLSSEALAKPVFSQNKLIIKTIHGALYAFNVHNGDSLWYYEHGTPGLILKASSAPVIAGPLVLAGFSDGKIEGISLETGIPAWTRSIAYGSGASDVERLVDIDADPIVRNNIAYIATYQGYIGALSLTDGQIIWNRPASVFKNMTLNGSSLYYTDSDDVVWSLNANTGKVNWKQDGLMARGLTEPAISKNQLAVADKMGVIHLIDTKDGSMIGRSQIPSAITIAPLSSDNHLYVMNTQGKLYDFKVSSNT